MAAHLFNTTLAEKYGIEEAIIINHLYFWIHTNEAKDEMDKNGRTWCYMSAKGMEKYISYMNGQKIRRILLKLEELGKILIDRFNASAMNHTLWYAFTDEFIQELLELDYEFLKVKKGDFKNKKSEYNKKEDNNKENKKDKNKFLSKKVEEQPLFDEVVDEKEKNYLEHMHEHYPLIMKMDKPLTYDEFKTLRENFDVDLVWDKMDNLENTKNMRKKYVSAYLTINNWCKMSFNREPKKKEDEQ